MGDISQADRQPYLNDQEIDNLKNQFCPGTSCHIQEPIVDNYSELQSDHQQ